MSLPHEERGLWVIHMSAAAYHAARKLEADCEQCGLDDYIQSQALLEDAVDAEDKRLWAQVWEYIQARTYVSCEDMFLVVLDCSNS
ncbi:hypothetical protein [Ruegeria arenilitoris]|uniref:hypothetical protein n=1 Tax=Ruegeria arenilitoris TaxID=1173585 RepID=UPI00147D2AA5|nr:hypothetical protein [Ruegeria arenilitoris]